MEFIIKQTDEILVFHSGLALIGAMLEGLPLRKRLSEISLASAAGLTFLMVMYSRP